MYQLYINNDIPFQNIKQKNTFDFCQVLGKTLISQLVHTFFDAMIFFFSYTVDNFCVIHIIKSMRPVLSCNTFFCFISRGDSLIDPHSFSWEMYMSFSSFLII